MTPGTAALISANSTGIPAWPHWIPAPVAVAVLVAAALSVAWSLRRHLQKPGSGQGRSTTAVRVAAVAAIGCTAYSADTSWRFAADYLDMGSSIERAAMFAAAELALFSTALLARANLNGPKQAPGLPGTLTWVITGVQIVPAYAESGLVGGTVRAFVGPVLAALLWHLAMGIELRHRAPDAGSRSLAAVLARQARERLLARLGIADQDADSTRIIRERALDQAVTHILRAETMTPEQRTNRRGRRLTRRLHQALEQADVDRDERQDELLLRKLATRQQALSLASVPLPARWSGPPVGSTGGSATARPRITAPRRAKNPSRPHQPARTTISPKPTPGGESPNTDPGRTARAKPDPSGPRPRAPRDVLTEYAHRMLGETGRLSRDLLEDTVRKDGYSVASDTAGEVVRTVKAELKAARAGRPH